MQYWYGHGGENKHHCRYSYTGSGKEDFRWTLEDVSEV